MACACASGVVRLFEAKTLTFKTNLPRPAARDSPAASASPQQPAQPEAFPAAVGCCFDCSGEQLAVSYADRSLLIWDVHNLAKVRRL